MEMTTATQRAGVIALARPGTAINQRVRDYITLTKPHIISLLLVTTIAPMIVAAGGWPNGWTVLCTMLGGYLMAGSANATNMYVDRDIDGRMARTALRPIPSGRMAPEHALGYASLLGVGAFVLLATQVNLLSAVLSFCGWIWYVAVYTLRLKRTSPQAVVIGGAAGAFPPLVGWAAVTGGISATAVVLFLIVFFWTPPHFWALALVKRKDYARVGVPMAPNVWGERKTLRQMLAYTWVLLPLSLAPVAFGDLGLVYGGLALLLGGWFLLSIYRVVWAEDVNRMAWATYRVSLLYLALLFGAMALDGLLAVLVW